MQIHALKTFLSVADSGGFHAAARKLNVTQTAVSARIRTLEQALGQELFTRGAGGTALSDFGHQFRPYAEQMVALWHFATQDLASQTLDRLSIRLGAQLSIWDPLLVDLAVSLEQNFGKLLLTLNYDHDLNMIEAVSSNVLDAAVTHEKPRGKQIAFEELSPERLLLVETPGHAAGDDAVFVNLELGDLYQHHVRSAARQATGQTIFLGNCIMALRYVLKRGGRGYFPDYVIHEHLGSGRLTKVAEARDLLLPMYLVTRPDVPQQRQLDEILSCLNALRQV